MLKAGDTIEYLAKVTSPASQKGIIGQTKVVDRDITVWTANYLLRGNYVRIYNPSSPLKIKKEKSERSSKTNGQGKHVIKRDVSKGDKAKDNVPA